MFLPRKILVANFFVAALLAPVAVNALGANQPADAPKPQPSAAVIAAPAAPAATASDMPAACAKPIRVILPGPNGAKTACAAPAKVAQ